MDVEGEVVGGLHEFLEVLQVAVLRNFEVGGVLDQVIEFSRGSHCFSLLCVFRLLYCLSFVFYS